MKHAKLSTDFKKYGLKESNIPEVWEDGFRTTGEKGTFEWWYFDAHLKDGSTAVIVFYTKQYNKIKEPLLPLITINIDKPDGSSIVKRIEYNKDEFSASKESCNVQIGKNYFRGNLSEYEIYFEDEDLKLSAKIKRTTESWRPKTGYNEFGDKNYFAWVVAVPQGHAELTYTYKGDTAKTEGSCYHDHNWGNASMVDLMNHWYWSRSEIGPYSVIASESISADDFNNESLIVYNLSKDGKTIVDNEELVKAYRTYGKMDSKHNKDISDDVSFIYRNPETGYRYEYNLFRKKTIETEDLLLSVIGSKNIKYKLAQMITGFDGIYYRFTGIAELKVYKNDELLESYSSDKAIWELMYLGKA
ncbi:hypothetical protein KO500_08340 [Cellulophaga baltica]|uniref:hypothetical protein n=1 Tax=Cellulophaga TaxID=104264 RepID=UPI001C06A190|nr:MULTISPECIES: hypothetical protein [Cellulophaga]MBU2996441.1 hypothetical protein [Cellulophaga baltica]MDO6767836.1 hypothetical protein [Cellulophaga sp. 1_MG-2023]